MRQYVSHPDCRAIAHPARPISHETSYTAIYALPRGEPRRKTVSYLRQDKPMRGRQPKGSERRGKHCNMNDIKDWPQAIERRLVPGHWDRDLIPGTGGENAIGTLVERTAASWCWCICPRGRPT
jgi:IS30 family transposase